MPSIVVSSENGNHSYLLEEGRPMFIGRARECDILLPSPAVSRRHAVVLFKNGICGIKDLGSFNGTLLNDQPITEPRHLSEGDVIRVSSFVLELHMNAADESGSDAPPSGPSASVPPPDIDTVDLAMETIPQPMQSKSPGAGPAHYANSTIRLPRAMQLDESVGAMINAIQPNPERVKSLLEGDDAGSLRPGPDTGAFMTREGRLRREEDASGTGPRPGPEAPRGPGGTTKDTLTPDDTAFFNESPAPTPSAEPGGEDGDAEEITAETLLTRAEAEAVIPLIEPEVAPTLTLDEDEATNAALEKLIEDLPTFTRERFEEVPRPPDAPATEPSPAPPDDSPAPDAPPASDEYREADDSAPFTPPAEEYPTDAPGPDTAFVEIPDLTPRAGSIKLHAVSKGMESLSIPPALMDAINARLSLYSQLSDLSAERKLLRSRSGGVPSEVSTELDRQDIEAGNLPTAEEAAGLIAGLEAERTKGAPVSSDMRASGDLALSQWLLIRDSNLDTLPTVYKEAYRLAVDEPLARELTKARIAHGRLFGGAVYLLALESLYTAAGSEARRDKAASAEEEAKGGLWSRLGRLARGLTNRSDSREETADRENVDRNLARLGELARREMKFMIRTLNHEFRQVYLQAALHFVPRGAEMPVEVRAFLRYGAIGLQPWWMGAETRKFILSDCIDNVVSLSELEPESLTVLYADEYLSAVSEMECSPSPDETLAGLERNSLRVKTDRAYRRIVNARTYNVLMERMLAGLDERMRRLERENIELETRMAKAGGNAESRRDSLYELQTEHQAVAIRRSNLEKHVKRIEKEVVTSIIESVQEAEGRFRKGELTMPTAEFLIRREVETMFDQCRRMEGRRERFLPLVLRQFFPLDGDVVNNREAIRAGLAKLEQSDPGVFVNVIIPAKKKINRVELRVSPIMVILPVSGQRALCTMGREGMEGGHLAVPICFDKDNLRDSQLKYMLADFRWETSRKMGGRDVMNSETLVGAFMRLRWEWRNYPKAKREKGMIFNENNDAANWRRVYEMYLSDAMGGGKQLFLRNPDCYNAIIGKYIDLPQGVPMLRRSSAAD